MLSDSGEVPDLKELAFNYQHYVGSMTVWKAEQRPQIKHLRRKEARRALDVYFDLLEEYVRAQHPEFWTP